MSMVLIAAAVWLGGIPRRPLRKPGKTSALHRGSRLCVQGIVVVGKRGSRRRRERWKNVGPDNVSCLRLLMEPATLESIAGASGGAGVAAASQVGGRQRAAATPPPAGGTSDSAFGSADTVLTTCGPSAVAGAVGGPAAIVPTNHHRHPSASVTGQPLHIVPSSAIDLSCSPLVAPPSDCHGSTTSSLDYGTSKAAAIASLVHGMPLSATSIVSRSSDGTCSERGDMASVQTFAADALNIAASRTPLLHMTSPSNSGYGSLLGSVHALQSPSHLTHPHLTHHAHSQMMLASLPSMGQGTSTASQPTGSSISFLTQMIDAGLAPQPSFFPLVMSQPGLHNIRSVGPAATMMASMMPPMPLGPVQTNFVKMPILNKKKKRKVKHVEMDVDTLGARSCDNGLSWFQHSFSDGLDAHGDQWDDSASCGSYQKLTRLASERHDGCLERFVSATVNASTAQVTEKSSKRVLPRKPALTKWKRIKFDQLKGNDAQELAQAFKSLAETTPGVELTRSLLETSWVDLTIPQLEKMLEETKKLLLVNEKVHDCLQPGCGRRFATPGNLRDHMNEHSGEKPYKCTSEGCGARFSSKQLFCRHMKKHERAHVCPFEGCGKRFAFRERLVVHQKIHSDERPLMCPWEGCGKTFKWPNSLHGHMRTHTGEKPFKCSYSGCGRLFGYKVDLTRHMRTHYGQPARLSH